MFLSGQEKQQWKTQSGTDEEKERWLLEKSGPKLRRIWYLMISICRLLQADDYTLPADEAYWLGMADELAGSDLPCLRRSEENMPIGDTAKLI